MAFGKKKKSKEELAKEAAANQELELKQQEDNRNILIKNKKTIKKCNY